MTLAACEQLHDILDPYFRYIFLDDRGYAEAFRISGLEKNTFLIHNPPGPMPPRRRSGYFVASDGQGIVRFSGDCRPLAPEKSPAPLYGIDVDLDAMTLVNRREFIRYSLPRPEPVFFRYEGTVIDASLVNVSEGGMRMTAGERLPLNVIYRFDLNLSAVKPGFHFRTDGLIIYCEPEDDPDEFMTGIAFILPQDSTDAEKEIYGRARRELGACLSALKLQRAPNKDSL